MINKKSLITILISSILLFITSIIKNETRKIEKNISKLNSKIKILEKDLYETQLDYFYLSSPKILSEKINFFSNEKYKHMNYSNIYISLESFLSNQNKLTKKNNEKKR